MKLSSKLFVCLLCFGTIISCSRYITTPGSKYRASAREYRLYKQNNRIVRAIEKQLDIKKNLDSLFAIPISARTQETDMAIDALSQKIDSVYRIQYINQDTIGEARRFETIFPKRLMQGIAEYATYLNREVAGQIWITFFRKEGEGYFYLMHGPVLPTDADGYALYQNRIQIALFDTLNYAKRVFKRRMMRKFPYNEFREIRLYAQSNYDGPLDVYKIYKKDSIEFIGRGFIDKNLDFWPYTPHTHEQND